MILGSYTLFFPFCSTNCFDYLFIHYLSNHIYNIIGTINSVRWNPSGNMLASASDDKTAKLIDFKTGKVLHTGNTADGSKLLNIFLKIINTN